MNVGLGQARRANSAQVIRTEFKPYRSGEDEMVSLASSVTATVIAGVVWFAFIVLYLAFYAGNMGLWQKAAVFLASGAIVGGIVAVFWTRYAFKAEA